MYNTHLGKDKANKMRKNRSHIYFIVVDPSES